MIRIIFGLIIFVAFVWIIITDGNPFLVDDSDKQEDSW